MSEQKWTPEDQWELIDDEHVCTLRIGQAYAGIPYQPPHGRGRCERQRADGRRLIQCVKACKGLPDPSAEIARLRTVEADYLTLRKITESDGETFRASMQEAIDARREAEAKADKLEADLYLAKLNENDDRATIDELRAQHAQDQADREHYMGKLGEALAELTKLRTVYAAAVEECRARRTLSGSYYWAETNHDAARAEAGMEEI